MNANNKAFSLVEVISCVAILGILTSLLLPLMQSAREQARQNECLDNLVTIGMAAIEFDDINGHLPPNLGIPEELLTGQSAFNELSNYQQTYALVQILEQLGESKLVEQVDPFAFQNTDETLSDAGYASILDWVSGTPEQPGIAALLNGSSLPVTRCPSDPIEEFDRLLLAVHPSDNATMTHAVVSSLNFEGPGRATNYVTNGGGIGVTQKVTPALAEQGFLGLHGPIRSRNADSVVSVPDGASNVAMFGEALGTISASDNYNKRHALIGGMSIGKATLYFPAGEISVFGDLTESRFLQFGSPHPDVVNFVRCDGSTAVVNRDIGAEAIGRFCGAADGNPFQLFLLGDVNQDGGVSLLDVGPFTDLIDNNEFQFEADVDEDGDVNLSDVQPFVDLLSDQ